MKKRVLSLLLVVAMLASLAVFPVSAAEGDKCPCGCGEAADSVKWETWNVSAANNVVEGGHYRLMSDIVTGHMAFGTGSKDVSFTLDLNGYVWSGEENSNLMTVGTGDGADCTVVIMDTVGGGEMQATGTAGGNGSVLTVGKNTTVKLMGGTLRQLYRSDVDVSMAGVLNVKDDAKFFMNGGKITDGYVAEGSNATGGNVRITGNAVFNMSGGEITNGHAMAGGGVYIASNTATFTMTGGKIHNNVAYKNLSTIADGDGGNIYSAGILTIDGTEGKEIVVKNGVASGQGNNIYLKAGAKTTTFKNVEGARGEDGFQGENGIQGDIYVDGTSKTSTTVTLDGTVKIPMGNAGGLTIAEYGVKVAFGETFSSDSEIYFTWRKNADASTYVFTDVGAGDYAGCFLPTGRTHQITATSDALTAVSDYGNKDNTNQSYCPHCGELVTWIRMSYTQPTNGVGNHYITNKTGSNYVFSTANAEVVIDLTGNTYAPNRRFANITATNVKVTVIDTLGGGRLQGAGVSSTLTGSGAAIYANAEKNATITIRGGTFSQVTSGLQTSIINGGLIGMDDGTLNIAGGIIDGGLHNNDTVEGSGHGGNIYLNNTDLNMIGGLVINGTARTNGGNIYVGGASAISITGGMLAGGTAGTDGGNLYLDSTTTTAKEVKNVVIRGGTANGAQGGNIATYAKGNVTIDNVTLAIGAAKASGGNAYISTTPGLTLSNSVIYNGTTQTNSGGNVFVRENVGNALMQNLRIYNGKAETNVAETNTRSDNVYTGAHTIVDNVKITGNAGLNELGSGFTARSTSKVINITLKNGTVIGSNKEALNGGLYLRNYSNNDPDPEKYKFFTPVLNVDQSFSGLAVLAGYNLVEEGYREEPYGQTLVNIGEIGNFTGKLYMGDHKTSGKEIWEIGMPQIIRTEDSKLVVEEGAVVKNAEGKTFYNNVEDAVKNYKVGDVLKLYMAEADMALADGVEYTIDLNGSNATVTGEATVYGIDSKTDDHNNLTTGSLVAADAIVNSYANDVDGDVYITTVDEESGAYEFHHIAMDIKSVVLRTSNAGVYYKGTWTCDTELEGYLKAQGDDVHFGIVASAGETGEPMNGFNTNNAFRWSYNSGAGFQSGAVAAGTLVQGILVAGNSPETNAENFGTAIHAKAYLKLADGSYIVGKEGASKSYMDMFVQIDKIVGEDVEAEANVANIEKMNNFYTDWADAIEIAKAVEGAYEFKNIFQPVVAEPEAPAES